MKRLADLSTIVIPSLEDPKHQPRPRLRRFPGDDALYWLFFSVLLAISCLPVWLYRYPPLWDYPNHLARAYILYNYSSIEAFQRVFYVSAVPIPNLAIDLFFLAALRFVDIYLASKFFLTFAIVLFFVGCHLLGRALAQGRVNWMTLPCSFLVYNSMFLWGFVNYIVGLGLFLVSLAIWLHNASRNWTIVRLSIVSALVLLTYLAHLSAFVLLVVTLMVLSLRDIVRARRRVRRTIVGLIPMLPALLVLQLFAQKVGSIGAIAWAAVPRPGLGAIAFEKLTAALTVVTSYNYLFDGLVLAVLLGSAFVVWMAKGAKVRAQSPLFLCGVILIILFLISPKELLTGSSVDARFVPPAVLLLLLSLQFDAVKLLGKLALALCVLTMFTRIIFIGNEWRMIQPTIEANVRMFEHFRAESPVFPIVPFPEARGPKIMRAALHNLVSYAVIQRHIMLPNEYAYRTQQPLVYRSYHPYRESVKGIGDVDWTDVFAHYRYVWSCNVPEPVNSYLLEHADLIDRTPQCAVFGIPGRSLTAVESSTPSRGPARSAPK
jgi:hypothetical protein